MVVYVTPVERSIFMNFVLRRGRVPSFYNYQLLYEKVFWDCANAYIITDVNTLDTDCTV